MKKLQKRILGTAIYFLPIYIIAFVALGWNGLMGLTAGLSALFGIIACVFFAVRLWSD